MNCAMHIQSLCMDAKGALWIATYGQGVFRVGGGRLWHYGTAEGLSDDVVTALAVSPDTDVVWAGTLSGGVQQIRASKIVGFTAADGLTGSAVRCLLAVSNNPESLLIVGSEQGGLVRWDGNHFSPIDSPATIASHAVNCLTLDRAGRLWVGTEGAGAFCRYSGKWVILNVKSGLTSDSIEQIIQDGSGNMWFGTDAGVARIDATDIQSYLMETSRTVSSLSGPFDLGQSRVKKNEGWPGALRDARGNLWFASNGGLLCVDPIHVKAVEAPHVVIEQVSVNGHSLPLADLNAGGPLLQFGSDIRSIDVSFTAISFDAPEKIYIRHKLEGFDEDWVQGDFARRAHYGSLPAGHYRFMVAASNADGSSNNAGAMLSFVIRPPFWQAWWFLTLGSLALVATIWAVLRYVSLRRLHMELRRSEQRHAMENERARIAKDMHDEIGSKLSRISYLSEVARQAAAQTPEVSQPVEAISGTSRELLLALDEIVWAVNPRNDNLEHLAGYLEQYAREYFQATTVECQISVPAHLPNVALNAEVRHNVFRAFEESLANTLKHAKPKLVRVEMTVRDHVFEIQVRDNGCGFTSTEVADKAGHDGLNNMMDRLRAAGGNCETISEPGVGTSVRLVCPLPVERL
jgi:signal transduction histidine kinase